MIPELCTQMAAAAAEGKQHAGPQSNSEGMLQVSRGERVSHSLRVNT